MKTAGHRKKRLTFPLAITILSSSTIGEYDMTPSNDYLEDLITEEELAAELDAEMREWDERNGITYEDGEDGEEYEYSEPDDSWMDADALASAGWGTDEDYGYYGEEAY
jgi:hypothetical protein